MLEEACKFCCAFGGISVIIKPPNFSLRWGSGVAKLDIHNVYAHRFILSTKAFLRTDCSPRYCVKKLKFLIPLFFGPPCTYFQLLVFPNPMSTQNTGRCQLSNSEECKFTGKFYWSSFSFLLVTIFQYSCKIAHILMLD